MDNLTLREIWIYPIKSLGGISVSQALVMEKGLQYDRRWMLIDEASNFLTQRTFPAMALCKLRIENSELRIKIKNDEIAIPLHSPSGKRRQVKVWNDEVTAVEVDKVIDEWFSNQLGASCSLVYFPEENQRLVDVNYAVNKEQVSLADAYPFLIIGQSSLGLLNSKLKEAVPMNRFRPNFVFEGGDPNIEDTWRDFMIGNNRFVGVKTCGRCALTTVNQETGEKGDEPLRTLTTYRKEGNRIQFGQNLVAKDLATVSVGDLITVQSFM